MVNARISIYLGSNRWFGKFPEDAGLCRLHCRTLSGTVGVLHVINLSSQVSVFSQINTGGYVPDRAWEDAQEAGRSIIGDALSKLPATISAEGFLEIGLPTDVIVAFCFEACL